jgi:hypothetical protein
MCQAVKMRELATSCYAIVPSSRFRDAWMFTCRLPRFVAGWRQGSSMRRLLMTERRPVVLDGSAMPGGEFSGRVRKRAPRRTTGRMASRLSSTQY